MRRWGLEAVTFVVVIAVGIVVLLATGVDVDELFDFDDDETTETPLSPLPGAPQETEDTTTTTALPVEVIVTTATTDAADLEATMLCVQHTKTFAFLGDQKAIDLWHFVGEDDDELARACQQLAREDSRAVDVWKWELAALGTPGTTVPGETVPVTATTLGLP
jgi:hypothetical protein